MDRFLGRTLTEELEELRRLTREQLTAGQILEGSVRSSDELLRRTFGDAYVEQLRAARSGSSNPESRRAHVEVVREERLALPPALNPEAGGDPEILEAEIIDEAPSPAAPTTAHTEPAASWPTSGARDEMDEFLSTRDPVRLRELLRANHERALESLERDGRLSLADIGIIETPTRRP